MNKYICAECGKACYSAAELEHLYNDRCPYCNGKIKPEIKDVQILNNTLVAITALSGTKHTGTI